MASACSCAVGSASGEVGGARVSQPPGASVGSAPSSGAGVSEVGLLGPGMLGSGTMLRAGLPRSSRVSATSTAGSTSQLYGVPSAESAMSSTPSRLPPSPSRFSHRSSPATLPSSVNQTGLRSERMTDVSAEPSALGRAGMNVRARPSANPSRGTAPSPKAWIPIQ